MCYKKVSRRQKVEERKRSAEGEVNVCCDQVTLQNVMVFRNTIPYNLCLLCIISMLAC